MRIFAIVDEETDLYVGTLLYYENSHAFIIELTKDLDEWSAPLLFAGYVKKKVYTILSRESLLWVRERVIPPERQNINSILKNHRLRSYDEMRLLELSHGRCSQDSLYIKRIEELPTYLKERAKMNVRECILSSHGYMICFFEDDTVRRIRWDALSENDIINKIVNDHALYMTGKVGIGGYSVTFNDSIDIPAAKLHETGEIIPISQDDFVAFARENILDTAQCCESLECTRQNLSYMIKKDRVHPVRENVMGNLFQKGDVLRNKW